VWMTVLVRSEGGSLNLRRDDSPSGPGTLILTVISLGSGLGSIEEAIGGTVELREQPRLS
jgi:hypothetical protein